MNAADFNGKTADETQKILQEGLDKFKAEVKEMKDIEALKELELKIDKEQEEFDNYVKELTYELSKDPVEFEGAKYSIKDIRKKIIYYINRMEVDFKFSLGLHALISFWKQADNLQITHGIFDSTLRILGQVKFKGDSEWVDILVINNYMTCAHDAYVKTQSMFVQLAEKRSAVVDQMQLVVPMNESHAVPVPDEGE